jgi:hypothetical protein
MKHALFVVSEPELINVALVSMDLRGELNAVDGLDGLDELDLLAAQWLGEHLRLEESGATHDLLVPAQGGVIWTRLSRIRHICAPGPDPYDIAGRAGVQCS